MLLRKDKNVYTYTIGNGLEGHRLYPREQTDFQIAIGLEEYGTSKEQNDPSIVQWVALFKIDGVKSYRLLKPCLEADFAKFYPPEVTVAKELQELKEKQALYCLDWQAQDFYIYGTPSMSKSERNHLELRAAPCSTIQKNFATDTQ